MGAFVCSNCGGRSKRETQNERRKLVGATGVLRKAADISPLKIDERSRKRGGSIEIPKSAEVKEKGLENDKLSLLCANGS